MVWTIWKSRNKNSIEDKNITTNKTIQALKEAIADLVRKGWNAMRFMEEKVKANRQRDLHKLWADGKLTDFDHISGPEIDFT